MEAQEMGITKLCQERRALLHPHEVADRLGLKKSGVLAGRLRQDLPWVRIGLNVLRMKPEDLDRYIQEHLEQHTKACAHVRSHHDK